MRWKEEQGISTKETLQLTKIAVRSRQTIQTDTFEIAARVLTKEKSNANREQGGYQSVEQDIQEQTGER